VYAAMGAALRRANAMDFDDLLLHPLTLFAEHPEILARYRERFRFLLVDEYQDTNRAQYLLLKALAGETGNVFVVGDDDQSIYGWRGADLRNILEFQRDYPAARLVRLEENYRSTQAILEAANSVIAPNTGRLGKTLFTPRTSGTRRSGWCGTSWSARGAASTRSTRWRCSCAPTPRPARSRRSCGAGACRTAWWAR